jgi:DNA-binding NarL/FixJ family response regulator
MKKKAASRPAAAPPPVATPAPQRHRVLLVDDHPFMRAGLGQLIDRQPDLIVCGEAGNPAEAIQAFAKARPDIVLSDLTMPGRSGLEFVKDLLAVESRTAVLVVSMHDEVVYAERALRAGAAAIS